MSHFTVLVIGDDVEGQLEPYNENTTVEAYKRYWDSAELRQKANFLADEKYAHDKPVLTNPETATPKEIAAFYNERYGHGQAAVAVLDDDNPDGVDEEKVHVDEGGVYEWTRYNPKSKWDWWVVGGRWTGFFMLKDEGHGELGEPGTFGNKPKHDVDSALKEHIDIEGMRDKAGEQGGKDWDRAHELMKGHPEPRSWEDVISDYLDPTTAELREGGADEARKVYWEQPAVKAILEDKEIWGDAESFSCSREEYVIRCRNNAICPYAYVKEGKWFAPGEMGWFGMSTEKDNDKILFAEGLNALIDSLPDDTLLTIVDCHI